MVIETARLYLLSTNIIFVPKYKKIDLLGSNFYRPKQIYSVIPILKNLQTECKTKINIQVINETCLYMYKQQNIESIRNYVKNIEKNVKFR